MTTSLLDTLRDVFNGRLLSEPSDMAPFLTDWRGKWTGQAHQVPVVRASGKAALAQGGSLVGEAFNDK